jgi:uncharacterized protein YbjQ (UPF0145 family)
MESPADIYQTAYQDHYKHSELDAARAGYHRLVNEFPKSEEAGYARTQLWNLDQESEKLAKKREVVFDDPDPASIASKITVTTAPSVDGFIVEQTFDVVTAECVLGVNVFRDMFAGLVTDVIGGRSKGFQQSLRNARTDCLAELRREAQSLGANGVIATSLNYSELSGSGKSMLFVVAVGTAVRLRKIDPVPTEDLSKAT